MNGPGDARCRCYAIFSCAILWYAKFQLVKLITCTTRRAHSTVRCHHNTKSFAKQLAVFSSFANSRKCFPFRWGAKYSSEQQSASFKRRRCKTTLQIAFLLKCIEFPSRNTCERNKLKVSSNHASDGSRYIKNLFAFQMNFCPGEGKKL